ncbi:MAG: hypothetical protein A3G08_04850 [Candidatus Magasanikbacteria bacterium RIFCSPLOWO2_12_FULL_47_9b]|nr:MAG: hypothetical protein A3G08_04850 [Candidatus Magasanikbacteria bacterium RIFCSPLOWO2_12_FULL_47_9b]
MDENCLTNTARVRRKLLCFRKYPGESHESLIILRTPKSNTAPAEWSGWMCHPDQNDIPNCSTDKAKPWDHNAASRRRDRRCHMARFIALAATLAACFFLACEEEGTGPTDGTTATTTGSAAGEPTTPSNDGNDCTDNNPCTEETCDGDVCTTHTESCNDNGCTEEWCNQWGCSSCTNWSSGASGCTGTPGGPTAPIVDPDPPGDDPVPPPEVDCSAWTTLLSGTFYEPELIGEFEVPGFIQYLEPDFEGIVGAGYGLCRSSVDDAIGVVDNVWGVLDGAGKNIACGPFPGDSVLHFEPIDSDCIKIGGTALTNWSIPNDFLIACRL